MQIETSQDKPAIDNKMARIDDENYRRASEFAPVLAARLGCRMNVTQTINHLLKTGLDALEGKMPERNEIMADQSKEALSPGGSSNPPELATTERP